MKRGGKTQQFRKRLAKIVEVGAADDLVSRGYDFAVTAIILVNLAAVFAGTFDGIEARFGAALGTVEAVTSAFFAVDYLLRLFSAKYIYHRPTELRSLGAYALSFGGIVDLLSFLPHYLPIFFPAGAVAFRIFRIVRIFRLFRVNAYYDSLNVITEVLAKKRQQLLSSVFIILILMLAASLCMYSIESAAQPEVFSNAFSGLWWAVSTLLTVGYGDIYPITPVGKAVGIVITFLGVGMVAIPTGIISAGFVEQYASIQRSSELASEMDIHFIKIRLRPDDSWVGQSVACLRLPNGIILAAIRRDGKTVVPRGDVMLKAHDMLILGAEPLGDDEHIELKEITLRRQSPWNGQHIRDLDISRQSIIISVHRGERVIIPNGSTKLLEGDTVLLYTKRNLPNSRKVEV